MNKQKHLKIGGHVRLNVFQTPFKEPTAIHRRPRTFKRASNPI